MAQYCKECGKRLLLIPVRELCSDCELKLNYPDEKPAKPATIYCRLCGGELSPESKFCRYCGQLVLEAPTTIQEANYVDSDYVDSDYVDYDYVDLSPQPAAQTAYQQQEYQQPQPIAQPQPILQPVPQPSPKEDPMEKLAKLKKMVKAGLITEEDYDTKKTEVLSKM